MRQQVPDGDRLPRLRRAFKILAYAVVELDLAILDQQHDAGSDKLFADGTDLVNRLRRGWNIELDVSETVTQHLHDLLVLNYNQRKSRKMLPLHFRLDVVINFVCPNSNRCGEQQYERENVLAFKVHGLGLAKN